MDSGVAKTGEPPRPPRGWPRISDYWPDAPHRLGPPADHYELPGVDATRTGPALHTRPAPPGGPAATWIGEPPGRAGKDLKPLLLLVATAVLAGGAVFAAVSYARDRGGDGGGVASLPAPPLPAISAGTPPATPPVSIGTSPPPSPPATPATPSAPSTPATRPTEEAAPGGAGKPMIPDAATFELATGVTQLRVVTGDVRNGFFRISVGDDSRITAKAVVDDDTVRVTVTPNGRTKGSARLEVLLDDDVRWSLRMRGGVNEAGIDLSGGRVGGIDLVGGAATVDLVVPDQRDAIPIVQRDGIGTWRIVTGGKVPVRAFFREGAGSVTLYGDTEDGVGKGTTLRDGRGDDGIRVDSAGGVGALTVQGR
ncbi:hypothetical protein [Actinoplanes siamensis]|uniref:Uncharacterized protein n=1 Tax=Actinoplanes siamensis TaxID=1223317 RepID=A0A919N951_9ACTN|nr:hypothetical protein [Actinoplanes siamensis]GIF06571.1 hypothetical protein Asi03nite_41090 [Actinoplanes siamensis]